MGRLQILDADYNPFGSNPLRTFHDGHLGDSYEQLVFVRNGDASKWYTNVFLTPVMTGGYSDDGEFGTSGWGVKLIPGRRRPTEEEWDLVEAGSTIQLDDIGSVEAADTFTNHPVWVRIYCPGNEDAQTRENVQLQLSYLVKEVQA